ncbi:MAG: S46 family peptidase [Pseudomonadota bacterium]
MKRSLLFAILFLIPAQVRADAMYLPIKGQMPLEEMKRIGLTVPPERIEALVKTAVGVLQWPSGGCTATFLSKDGLLGTNSHCADFCASAIQAESLKQKGPHSDLVTEGYVAANEGQEIVCPNYEFRVPFEVQNVSKQFADLERNQDLSPKEWAEKVRYRREELREKCRGSSKEIVCDVVRMNTGAKPYVLYKYRRYTDLRLVWFPPDVIGEFGGETDNWEYPRHTGDFSFLRVYQGNQPFRPATYARASASGIKPGDPQFILGYPGATQRNITSFEVEWMAKQNLPLMGDVSQTLMDTLMSIYPNPQQGPYGNAYRYLANFAKNFPRKAEMIRTSNVVAEKRTEEETVRDRANLDRLGTIFHDLYSYYPTILLSHVPDRADLPRQELRSRQLHLPMEYAAAGRQGSGGRAFQELEQGEHRVTDPEV